MGRIMNPNYILTVLIVAGILWLFGWLCKRQGEIIGFRRGCQSEREYQQWLAVQKGRTTAFWISQN